MCMVYVFFLLTHMQLYILFNLIWKCVKYILSSTFYVIDTIKYYQEKPTASEEKPTAS